ncbi:hypothetical protein [Chryseobacterium rhizosphaerae]|uniref:hypothetical protein n=1 Tax=Chryseobacterium rhizosphaerae TaxID=395937 RepID=UPI003D12DD3B
MKKLLFLLLLFPGITFAQDEWEYVATTNSEDNYFIKDIIKEDNYTLDVDVQDCQVIQINFPNDGYLDDDHISYANISDDGSASVDGEDGKTYQIQIDN